MHFPMKIQPIDIDSNGSRETVRADSVKPVLKSRLKRLFDRQFPSVLRSSSTEKPTTAGEVQNNKDGGSASGAAADFEPSSVCLAKMVLNFMEENNDKQSTAKCGRTRCNCFNVNNDSSDDEFDVFGGFTDFVNCGSCGDACDSLKCSITCASIAERNVLADTTTIVEKNKNIKRKDDLMKIITDGLSSLGYDSSICKSKWDKSPSFPAGEYEYIDVIVEGERLLIDVDFRSEFEIARSTGSYKAILQYIPNIFVGKPDRVGQIVSIVSEAAKQSLKKKGLHFPPWRKAEYMRAKWLSPFTRTRTQTPTHTQTLPVIPNDTVLENEPNLKINDDGELELIFGENVSPLNGVAASPLTGMAASPLKEMAVSPSNKLSVSPLNKTAVSPSNKLSVSPSNKLSASPSNKLSASPLNKTAVSPSNKLFASPLNKTAASPSNKLAGSVGNAQTTSSPGNKGGEKEVAVYTWTPPALKPKIVEKRENIVTGLASLLKEGP